jgi:integrase
LLRKGALSIAKRRGNGEGCIYKRKDGRWECRFVVGKDENGKWIRKNAIARNHKEIVEKLQSLKEQYKGVVITSSENITVDEWLNRWLDEYKKPFIRPNTYTGYKEAVKQIVARIGTKQISRLRTEEIQKMYNELREDGRMIHRDARGGALTANYVRKIHMVLQAALEYAVNERMISSNPASATKLPKVVKKEKKVMLDEEVEKFIEEIDKMPYWRDLFYLEIMTGLRRGEICGLTWDDLDEKTATLKIERSIDYKHGELVIGEPKTEDGKRVIILPTSAFEMLTQRKVSALSKWMFPKSTDPTRPVAPGYAYQKLQDILKKAGIEKMRFHDLRHTFATHAAKNGVDPKTLAGLLGHTNASFTLDTYTHVTSDMQKAAASVVENFLDDILGEDLGFTNELVI